MLAILAAVLILGSAVPAFMIVQSVNVDWFSLDQWVRIYSTYLSGDEAIPTSFVMAMSWTALAPLLSLALTIAGVLQLRRPVADTEPEMELAYTPDDMPDNTPDEIAEAAPKKGPLRRLNRVHGRRTKSTGQDTEVPLAGIDLELREEPRAPTNNAGDDPHHPHVDKPSGRTFTASRIRSLKDRLRAVLAAINHKIQGLLAGSPKTADNTAKPRHTAPRPVVMRNLRQHAVEIYQDTRVMVADMFQAEDNGLSETDPNNGPRNAPTKGTTHRNLWSRLRGKSTGTEPDAMMPDNALDEKDEDPQERSDSKLAAFQDDALPSEILAFYGMWTAAGQNGRTPKMRKQARRLAEQLTENVSTRMISEYGMRGYAALNTLKAAAGIAAEEALESPAPARPMAAPEDDDLLEDDIEIENTGTGSNTPNATGSDNHAPTAEPHGGTPASPRSNAHASPFEAPEDLRFGDGELDTTDPLAGREQQTYDAQDGYAPTDTDPFDGVQQTADRETEIDAAARAMVGAARDPKAAEDQQPHHPRSDAGSDEDADEDEDLPDEAYAPYTDQPLASNGWSDDDMDDDGTVQVYDDLGGDDESEDDTDNGDTHADEHDAYDAPGYDDTTSVTDPWNEDGEDEEMSSWGAQTATHNTTQDTSDQAEDEYGHDAPAEIYGHDASRGKPASETRTAPGAPHLGPIAQALVQQIDRIVDYQTKAFGWEQLHEQPPEKFDTEEKRRDFLQTTATAIVALREQLGDAEDALLRSTLSEEQMRWLDGRAEAVKTSLMRGGHSDEAHGHMGARTQPAEAGWVEYRYQEAWTVMAPNARKYKMLTEAHNLRFYKAAHINPGGPDEEMDDQYDVIDVLMVDPRPTGESGGYRPGMMGVAFAIVPGGDWVLERVAAQEAYEEGWVLRAKHGDGGKVRLRDRSLSIFGEWARKRGRRPSAVLHLIMEDGARVDGLSEEAEIADYIGRRFGADRNVRVISRVWSDREFADAILPEVIGEAPGSQA